VSTDVEGAAEARAFDLDAPWQRHPHVSARPERFGALLYHFDTRRLSFLKTATLAAVVDELAGQPSARAACRAAAVPEEAMAGYERALADLAASGMICPRETAS
jgi:mycofactocin biosynthesis protein MftB